MPFGMVSGVGRVMGVLYGGGDRRRRRAVLGVNFGRPIVTNGGFAMWLFPNYFGQDLFSKCRRLFSAFIVYLSDVLLHLGIVSASTTGQPYRDKV